MRGPQAGRPRKRDGFAYDSPSQIISNYHSINRPIELWALLLTPKLIQIIASRLVDSLGTWHSFEADFPLTSDKRGEIPVATYYVNGSTGKDTNAGTSESTPWQSVARVNEAALKPGDVVLFSSVNEATKGSSSYLAPPASGESGKPITFGAYGGGKAHLPITPGTEHFPHVSLESVKWLVFENLILSAKSVNEAKWLGGGGIVSVTSGTGAADIVIRKCEFLWDEEFILNASKLDDNWTIESCTMEHSASSGLICQGIEGAFPSGWKILKNKIYEFGETEEAEKSPCHGIYARLKQPEIKENELRASKKCKGQGISLRGSGSIVEGNSINGNGSGSGIGYFTFTKERGTTKIAYNRVYNCLTFCFYCTSDEAKPEEGQGDIGESFVIANNTFSCNAKTIVEANLRNAKNEKQTEHLATMKWIFKNNILNGGAATTEGIYLIVTEEAGTLETYEEDYNLFGLNGTQEYRLYATTYASYKAFHEGSGGAHDKNASPEYEVGEPTYSPKSTSPTVQAGTASVSGFTYTKWVWAPFAYNGPAPTIGAQEYT
jgi:hypothetical protein